jgi:hypothetical protein
MPRVKSQVVDKPVAALAPKAKSLDSRPSKPEVPLAERVVRHIAERSNQPGLRLLEVVYGPKALTLRAEVASLILGRRISASDKEAQYGHLRLALLKLLGATGKSIADTDKAFESKAGILLTPLTPVAAAPAPAPPEVNVEEQAEGPAEGGSVQEVAVEPAVPGHLSSVATEELVAELRSRLGLRPALTEVKDRTAPVAFYPGFKVGDYFAVRSGNTLMSCGFVSEVDEHNATVVVVRRGMEPTRDKYTVSSRSMATKIPAWAADVYEQIEPTRPAATPKVESPTISGPIKTLKERPARPVREDGRQFGTSKKEIFGQPMTAVMRALGKMGWGWEKVQSCLKRLGVEAAESTIRQQVKCGGTGERGAPATLTPEQIKEIEGCTA